MKVTGNCTRCRFLKTFCILLRMSIYWTEKTEDLQKQWKRPFMQNWNNHSTEEAHFNTAYQASETSSTHHLSDAGNRNLRPNNFWNWHSDITAISFSDWWAVWWWESRWSLNFSFFYSSHNYFCQFLCEQLRSTLWTTSGETVWMCSAFTLLPWDLTRQKVVWKCLFEACC